MSPYLLDLCLSGSGALLQPQQLVGVLLHRDAWSLKPPSRVFCFCRLPESLYCPPLTTGPREKGGLDRLLAEKALLLVNACRNDRVKSAGQTPFPKDLALHQGQTCPLGPNEDSRSG